MMEAVFHASGSFPFIRASLQKPSRSVCRDGIFQTAGGMLSRSGDLEDLIALKTVRSSSYEDRS